MSELYTFDALKKFLKNNGCIVGDSKGYKLIRVDFEEAYTNGKIDFKSTGIFYLDENGFKRQGYMYQTRYLVDKYGLPKFHIFECETIRNFLDKGVFDQYYSFSTANTNDIIERKTGKEFKNVSLSLCGYCRHMLHNMQAEELFGEDMVGIKALLVNSVSNTQGFYDALGGSEQNEMPEQVDIDMFGYVKEWQKISEYIREKHQYVCENCGVILNGFNKRFLEVHHINGNQLDNREYNLKCLCIRCHSEIDKRHKENYQVSRSNRIRLQQYLKCLSKGEFQFSNSDTDSDIYPF